MSPRKLSRPAYVGAILGVLTLLVVSACRPSVQAPSRSSPSVTRHMPEPPAAPPRVEYAESSAALGPADGVVRGRVTVFADVPAVTKLSAPLRGALRRAASDAQRDGVTFYVDSGWRSAAYQEQLLRQAVATYGSREKAARWVATPGTSAHVSGNAVDLGHDDARRWLARQGARYGLCRTYRNEPWHFELRPGARDHGCPRPYADPSHDPRMQQ